MKIQNVLIGLLLLIVVGGGTYFAYRRVVAPDRQCEICGRNIHAGHEATVLMKDGTKVHACCPRCALHRGQHGPGAVRVVLVTDRTTGQQIQAQDAVYVEGSDEVSCMPKPVTPPREPGVTYDTVYDRCVPSLVAFKSKDDALKFSTVHGGQILSYGDVLESVRER